MPYFNPKTILIIALFITLSCNSNSHNSKDNVDVVSNQEKKQQKHVATKIQEIDTPQGFERTETTKYGKWIRNINLTEDNIVYYFDGSKKANQSIHVAVLDLDIGNRDLQQCADACMRIRSEYLFEQKDYSSIKFLFANGKWSKSFEDYTTKRTHEAFRSFMNYIYSFANTASLKKQMTTISDINTIEVGDVFVQSGSPYGHAITVMDVCKNERGDKMFMVSQSYMPAQSIEVLVNPENNTAWYPSNFIDDLVTPQWTFTKNDLKRF